MTETNLKDIMSREQLCALVQVARYRPRLTVASVVFAAECTSDDLMNIISRK